jgi:hypothetical protein
MTDETAIKRPDCGGLGYIMQLLDTVPAVVPPSGEETPCVRCGGTGRIEEPLGSDVSS